MAKAGDSIESPAIGDRIVFLKTARDTNGALLEFDDYLKVGGNGPVEHIHTRQEERLEVVSGIMRAKMDGREQAYKPGECAIIPAGIAHQWWNDANEELHIRATFVPALKAVASSPHKEQFLGAEGPRTPPTSTLQPP